MPAYLPELDVEGLARHVEQSYRPGLGTYLGAHMRLGFDTSTPGMALMASERLGADPGKRLSEAEWRASPHWRQDLEYDPDTTEGLAEVRANQHDERKWTNDLIAKRDAGAFETVLGFGAGLVGSIPDPINLVPFVGPAWRAAMVARAGTRAAFVARSAAVGAVEGAVATTALTPLIMHESKYIGDEMSWADAGLNIAIGAALSGVVGGAGGAFASRGGRVWSREGLDLAANERTRAVDAQADTTIAASQIARGEDVDLGPGHRSRTIDAPEPDAPLAARLQPRRPRRPGGREPLGRRRAESPGQQATAGAGAGVRGHGQGRARGGRHRDRRLHAHPGDQRRPPRRQEAWAGKRAGTARGRAGAARRLRQVGRGVDGTRPCGPGRHREGP